MNLLDSLAFIQLLWLVPVFFMFHNMEEAPFMANWLKQLPVKFLTAITTRQFVMAVSFLTLVGFFLTFMGLVWLPQPTGYLIILEIQMAIAFNSIVPHLFAALRFRTYNPGVVTAVLINLPFSFYLFQRALNEGIVVWAQVWVLLALAPFVVVLSAWVSLQIGKRLVEMTSLFIP